MDALRLYLRCVSASWRSQMQYRASFVLQAIGQLLVTGVEFLAIWALFHRFGSLRGWRLEDVALLYGMANVSFCIAEAGGRGFDLFPRLVVSGDFDRLLLRPRSTAFQVAASEVQPMRVGRLLQGGAVLGWAVGRLCGTWGAAHLALLLAAVLSGACLFAGVFVLQATLAFWTTEGLEVVNVVSYGGLETAQYPMPIYRSGLRAFFTWVVPLACAGYLPSLALTGRPDPLGAPAWASWASPAAGPLFLLACLRAWRVGVRRYRSTGS
jgi:ABC-2 type transport system permease protein